MDIPTTGFGEAIGAIASGCFVLGCQHGGSRNGVLVSWVQQASFEPLAITVALRKGRPAVDMIEASRRFSLSVLGESAQDLMRHFGKGHPPDVDAFAGLEVGESACGPILASAAAWMGCEVQDRLAVGDHYVYVGRVVAGEAKPGARPMVHIRRSGVNY